MKSPLIIGYWEGGEFEHVSLPAWLRFIATPPERMRFPAPPYSEPSPHNAKCFAGVMLGRRFWGYDFIIQRLRRLPKYKNIRPLAHWRGGVVCKGYGRTA